MSIKKHDRSRTYNLFINLIIFSVTLCFSVLIGELALRVIVPLDTGISPQFRIPHPVLGWVLKPDASYLNKKPEATVRVTYNSGGWRDLEHSIEKPDGVFRILILGDSFMEAYSVELEDSFARQLEALARTSGYDIEVINLGVGGYGTLQEYLVFRDVGQLYQPDLVLLSFYVNNDVRNNSLELEAILATDQSRIINSRPFLDINESDAWKIIDVDFEDVQRRYTAITASQDTLASQLRHQSAILRIVDNMGIRRLLQSAGLWPQIGKTEQNGANESIPTDQELDLVSNGVNYCSEPPEYTRAWDVTERVLARLKADVNAIDSNLVVFTVPAYEEVNLQNTGQATSDWLCLEEAPGHARLTRILENLAVDLIPLLPEFRRVSREDSVQLFRQTDRHWNPEGHRLASRQVMSELIRLGYFPASDN